ncbi:MAG: TatD family hydrolase [Candidatus Hodarchaeota archaeon]
MYFDNHLHMDEPWLKGEKFRQRVIDDINENQIVTFAQSCSIPSYKKTLKYAKQSKFIFPTFGILPRYAHTYADKLDEVAKLCEEALMLGEIGLNVSKTFRQSIPHQRPLFEIFLKAAEQNDLIMNLLFRGTEKEGVETLKTFKIKRAIFHSYSGSLKLMDEIIDLGYFFSIGPVNLSRLTKDKIKIIPDDLFLLETVVLPRGKVPSIILAELLTTIAEIRNTSTEELAVSNQKNALKLIHNDPRLSEIKKLLSKGFQPF